MNTKIVRSPGRIANRRESERERDRQTEIEKREMMNAKVKRTSQTVLRTDEGREDEEIL